MPSNSLIHERPVSASLSSLLVALASFAAADALAFPYVVEDLGALPGTTSCIPQAINAGGDVVGWCEYPSRAFVFTDGLGMAELFGLPGSARAVARGINDAGVITGESWGGGLPYHALRWRAGVPEDLGAISSSSRGWDVSPAGDVVGETPVGALDSEAFLYTDDTGMSLLMPERYSSHAFDINEAGQIAGAMSAGNANHAFRFTPGLGAEDLGVPTGFLQSWGTAINVSGQVAGSVTSATGSTSRVMRFTDGIGIAVLGGVGESNAVNGMNSRGDLVGTGRPSAGIERAFLYTDEIGLQDLTSMIDPALGWNLLYAYDINDAGQIVGLAWNNSLGAWRGYRLTPSTPVGPLAALAVAPARMEAGIAATGWATLTLPAPSGGAVVDLSSTDPQIAGVPDVVTVSEGERHGRFAVTTGPAAGEVTIAAVYDGAVRVVSVEVVPSATGVRDGHVLPTVRVRPPFPNPASPVATIRYELSRPAAVQVGVYSVAGRLIRTLVDSPQEVGVQGVSWNGRDSDGVELPGGVYVVRVRAGGAEQSTKLVLVR